MFEKLLADLIIATEESSKAWREMNQAQSRAQSARDEERGAAAALRKYISSRLKVELEGYELIDMLL